VLGTLNVDCPEGQSVFTGGGGGSALEEPERQLPGRRPRLSASWIEPKAALDPLRTQIGLRMAAVSARSILAA